MLGRDGRNGSDTLKSVLSIDQLPINAVRPGDKDCQEATLGAQDDLATKNGYSPMRQPRVHPKDGATRSGTVEALKQESPTKHIGEHTLQHRRRNNGEPMHPHQHVESGMT